MVILRPELAVHLTCEMWKNQNEVRATTFSVHHILYQFNRNTTTTTLEVHLQREVSFKIG